MSIIYIYIYIIIRLII